MLAKKGQVDLSAVLAKTSCVNLMRPDKPSQGLPRPLRPLQAAVPVRYETVIPNPQLKLLDQMLEVMRLKH